MDNEGKYLDWNSFKSKFLTGDLVRTEFGPSIIMDVRNAGTILEQYSLWPLPGCKHIKRSTGTCSPKFAWYMLGELELVEYGPAHFIRKRATRLE